MLLCGQEVGHNSAIVAFGITILEVLWMRNGTKTDGAGRFSAVDVREVRCLAVEKKVSRVEMPAMALSMAPWPSEAR